MKQRKKTMNDYRRGAGCYICDRCGAAIGHYDLTTAYRTKKETLCIECFKEDVNNWLSSDPDTVAAALGYVAEKAETA